MAEFFAQRVIMGKLTYSEVPTRLKEAVAEALTNLGAADLITEN